MAPSNGTSLGDDVRAFARTHAPDLYITALLAPGAMRDDLVALTAFFAETGRVALTVSDPILAQIRLQWWRDALDLLRDPTGHPVADAVRDVMRRHGLQTEDIGHLIDAREEELYPVPFAGEAAFTDYLSRCDGEFLRLSAHLRGLDVQADRPILDAAAQALGRLRVALDMPYFAARGRLPLWAEAVGSSADAFDADALPDGVRAIKVLGHGARQARDQVRALFSTKSRRSIDAVLPVALLEPYLRALEDKAHDPLRTVATIAPLTRVSRLTWAHVSGRF